MTQLNEEVAISLPAPLKIALEEDCFRILRRGKLLHLPVELNVESLLRDYYLTCMDGATEETNLQLLSEVLDGIKIYFDFTLADHLLYGVEKEQHKSLGVLNPVFFSKKTSSHHVSEENMGRGGMPSQVYGPIHLLRLFVRLPQFLFRAQLPPGNVNLLHLHFRDLLGYMCLKQQDFFREEHYYETTPTEEVLPPHTLAPS